MSKSPTDDLPMAPLPDNGCEHRKIGYSRGRGMYCADCDEPDPGGYMRIARASLNNIPNEGTAGIDATLTERGKRYGKFTGHADVTQRLKHIMATHQSRDRTTWTYLDPDQKEALEMIAHKIGRILNGDPNYADSWVDIAGYAKLVVDRLEGIER